MDELNSDDTDSGLFDNLGSSPTGETSFSPHDVVLGKGNGVNNLPGNQLFRTIVEKYKGTYAIAPRSMKGAIADKVIEELASLSPPGRFLEPQTDNKSFKEVTRKRALEKTCQALREKKSQQSASKQSAGPEPVTLTPPVRKVSPPSHNTLNATNGISSPPFIFRATQQKPVGPCSLPVEPQLGVGEQQAFCKILVAATPRCMEPVMPPLPRRMVTATESAAVSDGQLPDPNRAGDYDGDLASGTGDDEETPRNEVWTLRDNDVLYGGRGRKHFHRLANQRFLDLIKFFRQEYHASRSKKRVALAIIQTWRQQNPPGRFLQLNARNNKWYEIPQTKILEKTCQALRDLKRERGAGGVLPTIADRMVDSRDERPAQPHPHHQQCVYHPFPTQQHAVPPHEAPWHGGAYPPPPPNMMFGGLFVPRPAPSTHGGGHHPSAVNKGSNFRHPPGKKENCENDHAPFMQNMFYGEGFAPQHGYPPPIMYGAGFLAHPTSHQVRRAGSPGHEDSSDGNDAKKPAADIQGNDKESTNEKKTDNIVRHASSSCVHARPARLGDHLPLLARPRDREQPAITDAAREHRSGEGDLGETQ